MSFLSDLFEGNTGNLGHDLTAHFGQDLATAGEIAGGIALGATGIGLGAEAGLFGAEGAGLSGLDFLGVGNALGLGAGAAGIGAGADAGLTGFDALSAGLTPSGGLVGGAAAPAAASAASFAPDLGIADPTAFNSIDAAAGQAGVNGFPAAAGAGGVTNINAGLAVPGSQAGTDVLSAATPATPGNFLDNLGTALSPSNIGNSITSSIAKNPLGLALATGGLGYDIYKGQQETNAVKNLNQIATQQQQEGQTLENYLNTGTLPPGLMSQVQDAVKQAKARAISTMASQGLSTDPTKNSALAAEFAAIDNQVPQLTAQIGTQLLSAGQAATGLSSSVYTTLANIDQTQTAAIGKAIASMSAALSGKSPGVNLGGLNISAAV